MEEKAAGKITVLKNKEQKWEWAGKERTERNRNFERGGGCQARCVHADTGTVTISARQNPNQAVVFTPGMGTAYSQPLELTHALSLQQDSRWEETLPGLSSPIPWAVPGEMAYAQFFLLCTCSPDSSAALNSPHATKQFVWICPCSGPLDSPRRQRGS